MKFHRKQYDAVFLTNVPAFYKVNLFNEIQKIKIFLLYSFQISRKLGMKIFIHTTLRLTTFFLMKRTLKNEVK